MEPCIDVLRNKEILPCITEQWQDESPESGKFRLIVAKNFPALIKCINTRYVSLVTKERAVFSICASYVFCNYFIAF
jgi:hypothetical protein